MSSIKNRRVISKFIFSRRFIASILVLLQLFIPVLGYFWFYDFIEYFIGGFSFLSAVIVVIIINNKTNPAFKLAWILPMMIFPVFGGLFYIFIQTNLGGRKFHKRVKAILDKTSGHLQTSHDTKNALEGKSLQTLSNYIANTSGFPIYQNTDIKYFPLGEDKFEEMKKQLRLAKEFIFLEYFILSEGKMWNETLEILKEKANEGVEVRVMYDGMGTMRTLPSGYEKTLRNFGIKAKVFSPVVPLISTHQNNRDHRKILVIDGKVAFNGGINLADEYINELEKHGHWKDVAVMLSGEAVKSFTLMFLQMWNIDEKQPDDYFRHFKDENHRTNDGFVMPYADNPLDSHQTGEVVYMDIIHKAKNYVHIMSPYFIIDNEMFTALTVASQSGVDVKIILPHIPDKQIPFDIARSFYPALLSAGVEIFEYTPGFVHAKMFVSDDEKAVVGTINMDYRSLYHHFECATYMENIDAISDMEKDFLETLEKCQKITLDKYKKLPLTQRLSGKIFRLFAPLM